MAISHLYPTQRPALDLNFARQKRLDSRVTFTRGSTATYVGSDGLIKTAASGEARFDHDPVTGESLGLLVEESRTNSFQYSTELDNAYWDLATGLTKTANNAVSPDGNTTALLVTEDTSTGQHVFGKTANVSVSNNCMGIFVKPNGKTRVGLRQGAESYANVVFDLTGTGSVVFGNGFIEQYPNGWFRVTQSRQSNGNKTYFHLLNDADNALSYTGDGTSGCWIWGYQKEAGTFPTSIIPTSGSTVTRSADVASMTGTNFSSWYNQSEGTLLTTADYNRTNSSGYNMIVEGYSGASPRDFSCNTAASNPNFTTRYSFTSLDLVPVGGPIPTKTTFKLAGSYSADGSAAVFNGGLVKTTGATTSVLTPADAMSIGRRVVSSLFLNGHISRISYYPTRLSDTQLQALTL